MQCPTVSHWWRPSGRIVDASSMAADERAEHGTRSCMTTLASTSSSSGLSFYEVDIERAAPDARAVLDARSSMTILSCTSSSSGLSPNEAEIEGVARCFRDSDTLPKVGTKDTMSVELCDDENARADDDEGAGVSSGGILQPGRAVDEEGREGQAGNCHGEEKQERRDTSGQAWSEEELDSLWTGLRRHGRGNWAAMLLDSKLCFLKTRTVGELAERWMEEQVKILGNPDLCANFGRRLSSLGSSATTAHDGGDQGLQLRTIETDFGRASQDHLLAFPVSSNADSSVVRTHENLAQQFENQETVSLQLDPFEAGGPSSSSGLQLVGHLDELGRLGDNRQGVNLLSVFNAQSGLSPLVPAYLPGRSDFSLGAIPVTNVRSFQPPSKLPGRFDNSDFRFSGGLLDRIDGDFGSRVGSVLNLGSDWRKQEVRELTSWQQQLPHGLAPADQSTFLASSLFGPQEVQTGLQFPLSPRQRLGSSLGQDLGNKDLVSLPQNGGQFSSVAQRRRTRLVSKANATSAMNTQDAAPSKLPHWLREAVKARAGPTQRPLPAAIAAVVRATNMLYKHTERLLPPLEHRVDPMVPPRQFPKKIAKRGRPFKTSQFVTWSRSERFVVGHPSAAMDFSHSISLEGQNQPPFPPFEIAGPGILRSCPALGQTGFALSSSKEFPEFPSLSSLDHHHPERMFHTPASLASLSDMLARARKLTERGIVPAYDTNTDLDMDKDKPNWLPSLSRLGNRPQPDHATPVPDNDYESTSSKTVSDPVVCSNVGKEDSNSDDPSSEETISDDGTE